LDSKDFWGGLMPEAVAAHEAAVKAAAAPVVLGPRKRTRVDYREQREKDEGDEGKEDKDGKKQQGKEEGARGGEEEDDDLEAPGDRRRGAKKRKEVAMLQVDPTLGRGIAPWTHREVDAVEKQLFKFGPGRHSSIACKVGTVKEGDAVLSSETSFRV
jgi:hypothetical protein